MLFVILMVSVLFAACASTDPPPGAGIKRPSYPALFESQKAYDWLVLKCQLADVPSIPAGLDTRVKQFMGLTGSGYGNIIDYFHDVSYHRALITTTTVGWVTAPFRQSDLAGAGRLASATNRKERVRECLQAMSPDVQSSLDSYYGVVVVNNAPQDGGACYTGQQTMVINNKSYTLACAWFDPNSLFIDFAAHELAHGLGLAHSFDNTQKNCGGVPGEYCDPWDLMSAQRTFTFVDQNWPIAGGPSGGGPGLDAGTLYQMGWIPAANTRIYPRPGGLSTETYKLQALSHPVPGAPLVLLVNVDPLGPAIYTVEYRQADGWDAGFAGPSVPLPARVAGGTVLVHQFSPLSPPASTLIENSSNGAMEAGDSTILGPGGYYTLYVDSIDIATGSATVTLAPRFRTH